MHRRGNHSLIRPASRQRGAVLYVALIMLILLALLGIVGMQVTGLQERMSANYRAVNIAFQNAEGSARETECYVESVVNRTAPTCTAVSISQICDDGFDAAGWADAATTNDANVRSIGQCISGEASLAKGRKPVSEDPSPVYEITAFNVNDTANPTANAAIDTIFRP